jgi:hypothetical protein
LLAAVASIPELTALSVEINEGNFDLLAKGKKVLAFESRTRFEITSCEISAEKQIIVFRRMTPTDMTADGFLDRMLLNVFKAIISSIFQIDPANLVLQEQPGITIQDDIYTIDLTKMNISGQISSKITGLLNMVGSIARVKEIHCATAAFNVLVGVAMPVFHVDK